MKELNIEEKAKAYDEALENAKKELQCCGTLDCDAARQIFRLFPELAESEDERIRKALIRAFKSLNTIKIWNGIERTDILAWIEKQSEQKPCMIQWKGDNLKEVIDFTGKDKNFNKWFKSFEEYEKYVHGHNDIFKLFNEDGSHYEVPVGAWIVKTPDGRNVASKSVFKQKPTDTVEPKFKVGDLITNGILVGEIDEIHELGYHAEPNEHRIYYLRLSECKPIPLTSEILEKNGFTCDENIAKLVERDDTNNILWSAKYSFFTGMIEVVNKITDEKVKVRCYSVHELQHIFRLLEIEKTIEL